MKQGARAAKVCGAGGGGCVIFFVEPQAKQRASDAITANGGQVLPFKIFDKGLTVRTE
jgi:D-glycero-alpha-D-manno-heptose-7-phosphate kinase